MENKSPIIVIKKIRKKPHGGHGGAWKIAYADFVTAMMAFFLLMWLLNAVNEEERKGIADYFSPSLINSQSKNANLGLMGGLNVSNPNNSDGKSSEEHTKKTEIEVDVKKGKELEAFSSKQDVSKDKKSADKDKNLTNSETLKKNNLAETVEKSEHIAVELTINKKDNAFTEIQENKQLNPKPANSNQIKPDKTPTNKASIEKKSNEQLKIDSAKSASVDAKTPDETKKVTKNDIIKPKTTSADTPSETKKAEKNEPAKVDQHTINKVIDKIVKVDLAAIKTEKTRQEQAIADQKLLKQAIGEIKKNKIATTYERSISNAKSDKKIEQQKLIEQAIKESIEKKQVIRKLQKEEDERLKTVSQGIKELINKNPELQGLMPHIVIENRPEGLRIQLIDKDKRSMFASGSSSMTALTKQLLQTVAHLIEKLPNSLVISGHTDAHPYVGTHTYTNWELSADRANATRRVLEEFKIAKGRFESVMGKEATDPFIKEDPFNESNRRISITLLREYGTPIPDLNTPSEGH